MCIRDRKEIVPKKDKQEFEKEKDEVKNLSVGEKLPEAKIGNLSENKEVKSKMTKKMEAGVPLPLAVKDINSKPPEKVVELNKDEIVESPIGKDNILNEAKMLKRDILEKEETGDAKEERGKRDVEEVNRLDRVEKTEEVYEKKAPDFDKQDNTAPVSYTHLVNCVLLLVPHSGSSFV